MRATFRNQIIIHHMLEERGVGVLECIFADEKVAAALGWGKLFVDTRGTPYPFSSIFKMKYRLKCCRVGLGRSRSQRTLMTNL